MNKAAALAVWRHPLPRGVQGRCIGHTDLRVDPRKTKRLAHRIRRWARLQGAARVVVTSGLERAASVGRMLASWGWRHHVDARLNEMNFGHWDGLAWSLIGAQAVDAWCRDFAAHRPGGGESLADLMARCKAFLAEPPQAAVCIVGHAGWISCARWLEAGETALPSAAQWPASVRYGGLVLLRGGLPPRE